MKALLVAVAFLAFPWNLRAADVNAASCSRADVGTAYTSTVNGDRLVIPAGTCSWETTLTVEKAITVQCVNAVLQDDIDRASPYLGRMFLFDTDEGENWRLTGCEFEPGALTTATGILIAIQGQSKGWRIDNNIFDNTYSDRVVGAVAGWTYGRIDHNTATYRNQFMEIKHTNWGGGSNDYGDGSWAEPTNFGSTEAVYIEDNTFTGVHAGVTDGYDGARIVFRFNTVTNDFLGSHGTESSGRSRGQRHIEVYGNTFSYPPQGWPLAVYARSGLAMVFENAMDGYYNALSGANYSSADEFPPWGGSGTAQAADGTRPYDTNLNSGNAYESGTHTGSNGATVLTDSGADFSSYGPTFTYPGDGYSGGNQYSIINVTQGWSSFIQSVTATTTTPRASVYGLTRDFDNGDSYEIRAAYPIIDQAGYGEGDLLANANPTPEAWPNQAHERIYVWDNAMTHIDVTNQSTTESPHIQVGRDIIDDASTPGVTTGTRASRSATCTVGAAHWSTDQGGDWNTVGGDSNDGALDKCTATDTWTNDYYIPATYPFDAEEPTLPTLSQISPTSGYRGQTIEVTLTGTNFDIAGFFITISGSGVTLDSVNQSSATTATANFVIAGNASIGSRNVTVTTDSGTSSAQTFTVNQVPGGRRGRLITR